MSESIPRIVISVVVITFAFISLSFAKPVSGGGKLSLKLCIANAVGWLFILPLSAGGDPPPLLIAMTFFWLINLVLLPSAAVALWVGYKEREERARYVAVGATYVAMNLIVLFVVPFIWILNNASN